MTNSLNLGTGIANGATKATAAKDPTPVGSSREGATSRPIPEGAAEKPVETKDEVETRLDPVQPVSGDNAVASQTPEETFLDPPTPAEERKDTLEGVDSNEEAAAKLATEAAELERQHNAGPSADDGARRWSSHPIQNYSIGRFHFENGLLTLRDSDDIAEFEKILDDKNLPRAERARVTELDVSAAEAQVRAVRETQPRASKAIGSESGDRDPGKQVGRGTLEGTHGE